MSITVGLDVGGAHLKVARMQNGAIVDVRQFYCPLWQAFDKLDLAMQAATPLLHGAERVAVTMTGELSDLFPTRSEGVEELVDYLRNKFGRQARFFLGTRGFGSAEEAKAHPEDVGSMNFLATAEAIGALRSEALLIDFGSTTVDIIAVEDGRPAVSGFNDADRQVTGELVYTGAIRTAVMGIAQRAPLKGRWVGLAREYLATMADVRRVLGEDICELDLQATADGRGKSLEESTARLARMFGCNAADATPEEWRAAAAYLREAQLFSVAQGAFQVLSARPLPGDAPVVAAGIGANEAAEVARRLRRRSEMFGEILSLDRRLVDAATHHAPAIAVAMLLANSPSA